ncbi:MAG TPA: OB-fold nucleic acid binding domain-containing protein, partial [Alkalispirochaeta sp.]|nr:OB-fold nucleic acid binding domain-containing protein [Alkalispirochaeta sp.]
RKQGEDIFELLKPFAGYGFNKSHAAAYSILAYQTAYLKANYPVEFIAANLTNEINNTDKFAEYLLEARQMGITVRPPDINHSDKYFGVLEGEIVFGLVGIKNVGASAVDHILQSRGQDGSFTSFLDFLERIDTRSVNRKVIETLAQVGAFDPLGQERATILANMDVYFEAASHTRENRLAGQTSLFEDSGETGEATLPIEEQEPWSAAVRLEYERELLGFYFSGHPLDDYSQEWRERTTVNLARLEHAPTGEPVQVVGLLRALRTVITKKGDRMAIGHIEDYRGELELVAFPESYARNQDVLLVNTVVGCVGKLERRNDSVQMVLDEVRPLEELDERDASAVHIRLREDGMDEEALYGFRGELNEFPGRSDVYIHLGRNGHEAVVRVSSQLRVSSRKESLEGIERLPLVQEVWKT